MVSASHESLPRSLTSRLPEYLLRGESPVWMYLGQDLTDKFDRDWSGMDRGPNADDARPIKYLRCYLAEKYLQWTKFTWIFLVQEFCCSISCITQREPSDWPSRLGPFCDLLLLNTNGPSNSKPTMIRVRFLALPSWLDSKEEENEKEIISSFLCVNPASLVVLTIWNNFIQQTRLLSEWVSDWMALTFIVVRKLRWYVQRPDLRVNRNFAWTPPDTFLGGWVLPVVPSTSAPPPSLSSWLLSVCLSLWPRYSFRVLFLLHLNRGSLWLKDWTGSNTALAVGSLCWLVKCSYLQNVIGGTNRFLVCK